MRRAVRDVVVTGMGAVCSVGHDCDQFRTALEHGTAGIARIRRFDTSAFSVHTGAEVKDWPGPASSTGESPEALCMDFSERAGSEALTQARRKSGFPPPDRVGLVFGTGLGDLDRPIHVLTAELARALGIGGPCLTVSTACSSSTGAVGLGRDLIAMGAADAVLVGGADVLSSSVFAGFHALGVLNPGSCAPFSVPFGTTLGEGAGFLVLERGESACARGAAVLARLSGYGLSGDGYHETSPDPKGAGVERALRAALADAELTADDIGYVNAHGSGTEANDPAEWRGILRGLEGHGDVPVSSTKGAIGHTQGAAGALEAIATILMMHADTMPPTLNFAGARQFAPVDPIGGDRPRPHRYQHALCLNSAFGGSNVALVISRSPEVVVTPRQRRTVAALGVGLVGGYGLGLAAFEDPGSRLTGRVPGFAIEDIVPRTDPRGLDRSSKLLIAAAGLALQESGVRLRGSLRDRTGLFLGAIRPSPESLREFGESIEDRGLHQLSAAAFARIVLNAPAGFCSKALSLRGPLTAMTTGAGSGLMAIACAAELLGTRADLDLMIAAGVDELEAYGDVDPTIEMEGAAAVLLGRDEVSASATSRVQVSGWGVAGPGALREAVAQARATPGNAGEGSDDETLFDERSYRGESTREAATPSSLAFADALLSIRRGDARGALVVSDQGNAASVAVLLSA